MKRILKISLVILTGVVLTSWIGLKIYLRSSGVREQVETQLAAAYGGPASIDGVDIGVFGTTIHDLKLFEEGDDPAHATPLVSARSVMLDEPLWKVARGEIAPSQVHVSGAKVLVRFNSAGELSTRLPATLHPGKEAISWKRIPAVTVEESEVSLRKEGHGDLTADHIQARLTREGGRLILTGNAESEVGKLSLSGSLDEKSQQATARLTTISSAHVTQGIFERIPLVPTSVLREMKLDHGEANAALTVTYDLPKNDLHYRIDLDAKNAKFSLPSIAIAVQNGSGKLIVADNRTHLLGGKGETLGGVVRADGELSFDEAAIHLSLSNANAKNLDVADVPVRWGIPAPLRRAIAGGKLFGEATVNVTIGNDKPLQLEGHGKGEVRDPTGRHEPIEFDWHLSPSVSGTSLRNGASPPLTLLGTLVTCDDALAGAELQPQTPKYTDLKLNLKNASLAELIQNEHIKLPFPVEGKISLQLKASIPLDRLDDLKAYKADGSAKISQLSAAGFKLEELTADFDFGDGVFNVKSLKSAFADNAGKPEAPGALMGSGRIRVVPLGEMHADLRLDKVPIAALTDLTPQQAQGSISGTLTIEGNAGKAADAKALQANGKFEASTLVLFGVKVEQLGTDLALKDGVLSLPGLHARVDSQRIAPTASIQIGDDHSLLVQVGLGDRDLDALRTIAANRKIPVPPLTGSLHAKAVFKATTEPSRYAISGDIETKSLVLDKTALEDVRLHWELEGNQINLNASLYDGKLEGSARLPTGATRSAKVNLQVKDLNIRHLARDLRMPIAVDGRVAGSLKATLTPEAKGSSARAEIDVDFKSPMLRVQNIPAEQLQGKLEYHGGRITYNLTGKSLGGKFDLNGEVPDDAAPAKPKAKEGPEGRLRIKGMRVGQLLKALGVPDATDVRGLLNLDIPFTHDTPDRFPKGKGTLQISDIRYGTNVLATNIQGEVFVGDQQIRVRNLEGDLADGTLSGQMVYHVREPDRSAFTLNLDAVESGKLLSPWLDKKVEGPVQARIRGKLGSVCSGRADIVMTRGKIAGLEFADWRLPVSWSFSPVQGRATAEIAETSLQLAHGRAKGKLTVSWDNGARVDGVLRLDRVELGELVKQAGSLAAGRTTAKLEIKGSGVRSLDDLSGTLVASFEQAQALQLPVLQQISPFVGLGPTTTFQKGILVARLDGGTLRIQQLVLQGNNAQLFLDGTITMRQQMNLHVVAKTTDIGWPTLRLGPIGLRVPVAGPVPLVVAQQVSNLISNQVVYLDVTGTPGSPVIRPRPLQILSSEAVRFFLNPSNSPVTLNP